MYTGGILGKHGANMHTGEYWGNTGGTQGAAIGTVSFLAALARAIFQMLLKGASFVLWSQSLRKWVINME